MKHNYTRLQLICIFIIPVEKYLHAVTKFFNEIYLFLILETYFGNLCLGHGRK